MHREEQVGRRLEEVQLLLKQESVRAKRDKPLLRDEAPDDLPDLLVDQWLAARNGNHRRAAFFGGVEALLYRHPAVENGLGIIDLAAAGARQIAAEQGLQHENERIVLAAHKLLLEKIGTDPPFLEKRQNHCSTPALEITLRLGRVSVHPGGLKRVGVKVKRSEARGEA